MEIRKISYRNPMDRYFFQSFFDNLLVKVMDPDIVPDFNTYFDVISNPTSRHVWSCIVLVEDARVVGGVATGYLPKVACGVIEFIRVLEGYEDTMGDLLQAGVKDLWENCHGITEIYMELTKEEVFQPWRHLCKRLDFQYKAPALKMNGPVVEHLTMSIVGSDKDGVSGKDLKDFLSEFYEACYVTTEQFSACMPDIADDAIISAIQL